MAKALFLSYYYSHEKGVKIHEDFADLRPFKD